ncbi:MAG TPA: hypothetical protein VMB02_07000 [Candidatus Aquilonibacter sp.]|nr:hypothetical protein [Candidatus Aquilonibacter sp.]
MTKKHWRIFGFVQAGGILASFGACVAQDPLLLLGSGALLLPGSVTYWLTRNSFQPGYGAFLWPALISTGINLLLFALLSVVVSLWQRREKQAD